MAPPSKILKLLGGADTASVLKNINRALDEVSQGILNFSEAANNSTDNFETLLESFDHFSSAIEKTSSVFDDLGFKGTSAIGKILTPMKILSQGMRSFANFQRTFAELTGIMDGLSAGVRETYREFHELTNAFGGTYESAKNLSVAFSEIQKKSGSAEFGWVSREELLGVTTAMASANIEISRMTELIPDAGKQMDFLTASVLQADAMNLTAAEHMTMLSSAIMKTGMSSNDAFKQLAGFDAVAEATGLSVKDVGTGLQTAVNNFQQLGLAADFAKPLMLGFADSLAGVGIGIENAIGLSQSLAKSLGGLGEDYGMAYLTSQLGGLQYGQGGGALSAGIGIQKAMLDAENNGDFEALGSELAGAMRTMLEKFGGGEIVTVTDAANDPTKAAAFYTQQQLLSSQFSMTQTEATRTLEMLEELKMATSSGDEETASRLRQQLADQKEGRNDTIALMQQQNIHTAGIFANAQMQTRIQSMQLRNEAGGELLRQLKAESSEMGKLYVEGIEQGLTGEHISQATKDLESFFQKDGGFLGLTLDGKNEGADRRATLTESAKDMADDTKAALFEFGPQAVKLLEDLIGGQVSATNNNTTTLKDALAGIKPPPPPGSPKSGAKP